MRKRTYLLLISAFTALCIAVGCFLHIFRRMGSRVWGAYIKKGDSLEEIREIEVDADLLSLEISGGGEGYAYQYEGYEKLLPELSLKDGVLRVSQETEEETRTYFSKPRRRQKLRISLPEDAGLSRVDIEADLGNVELRSLKSENFSADLDMGNLEITDSSLGEARISCDMGNVKGRGLLFQSLFADLDMGNLDLETRQRLDDFKIDASAQLGLLEIDGRARGGEFHQDGKKGRIRLECSMGRIRLSGESAEEEREMKN